MLFDKFKKRDQKNNTTQEPRIISITCPNCGKQHQVTYVKIKAYYLDGTPQDIEGALSQIVLCDCGCVCKEGMYHWEELSNVINSAEYQDILNSNYDIVEKKLRLMAFFPLIYSYPKSWLTHVINDANQLKTALAQAIQRASTLEEEFAPFTFDIITPGIYLPMFQWKRSFVISNKLHLADLYRRAGYFDEALSLLKDESQFIDTQQQEYIKLQQSLIDAKITAAK